MTDALDLQVRTATLSPTRLPAQAALDRLKDPQRIQAATRDFEGMFIAELLRPMFDGLTAEAPFGGGLGEDMWRSMLAEEYGKAIAGHGGIGIADAVARDLLGAQEQRTGNPS